MVDGRGRLSTSRITFTSEMKYVWYMGNHLAISRRLAFVNLQSYLLPLLRASKKLHNSDQCLHKQTES